MTKKHALTRQPHGERPLPRLPHPSWVRSTAGGDAERRTLSAEDFWARLGI